MKRWFLKILSKEKASSPSLLLKINFELNQNGCIEFYRYSIKESFD